MSPAGGAAWLSRGVGGGSRAGGSGAGSGARGGSGSGWEGNDPVATVAPTATVGVGLDVPPWTVTCTVAPSSGCTPGSGTVPRHSERPVASTGRQPTLRAPSGTPAVLATDTLTVGSAPGGSPSSVPATVKLPVTVNVRQLVDVSEQRPAAICPCHTVSPPCVNGAKTA